MKYKLEKVNPMNYTIPPKKMLILNILDVLKKYSDENHRLSVKEISEHLEREYSQKVDRRAIKRNLVNLEAFGYDLRFSESKRIAKNGKEETVTSGWYFVREFTDSELSLLIDSLLFSKTLPYTQCRALIAKLKGLSNSYFNAKVGNIRPLPENLPENKQVFYTIDILDEAISSKKEVAFKYLDYGIDKKLHYRCDENGKPKEYTVSPYQKVVTNGRYYLIAYRAVYNELSNFRIGRIADIHVLEIPIMPLEMVPGFEHGLDLPRHMAEHVYMFTGESVHVIFTADRRLVSDIMDWFGSDVRISAEDNDTIEVQVKANETVLLGFAIWHVH